MASIKLSDVFRDKDSRVKGSILVLDICNSTEMKVKQAEANWITTYAYIFDLIVECVGKYETGSIVKYLGDGIMIYFSDNHAQDCINCAIEILEKIKGSNSNNQIKCVCSSAISTGQFYRFNPDECSPDYIGTTVDRAFRLCGVASQQALFVDVETVDSANFQQVKSRMGESLPAPRTSREYRGDQLSVSLKGFESPVGFHEVLWDSALFGPKSSALPSGPSTQPLAQAPSDTQRKTAASGAPGSRQIEGGDYQRAVVTSCPVGKPYYFANLPDGEAIFIYETAIVEGVRLQKGDIVFAIIIDAEKAGAKRLGASVIVLDEEYEWEVVRHPKGKEFIFVKPSEDNKCPEIFAYVGFNKANEFYEGSKFVFKVSENIKRGTPILQIRDGAS